MGPRSHERGNASCYDCSMDGVFASMGPRSHERGNGTISGRILADAVASMGPRSHERGNRSSRRLVILRCSSFNGAAFS